MIYSAVSKQQGECDLFRNFREVKKATAQLKSSFLVPYDSRICAKMPNSGFQGQINNTFEGISKEDIFPLSPRDAKQNLPNPAFWHIFVVKKAGDDVDWNLTRSQPAFSRHAHTQRMHRASTPGYRLTALDDPPAVPYHEPSPPSMLTPLPNVLKGGIIANSVAPFSTLSKPTCGYFFSRLTDQKKRLSGIPPADLVKWRYYVK